MKGIKKQMHEFQFIQEAVSAILYRQSATECRIDTYNFSFSSFWLADDGAAAAAAAAAVDDAIDVMPSLIFGVGLIEAKRKSKRSSHRAFVQQFKLNAKNYLPSV